MNRKINCRIHNLRWKVIFLAFYSRFCVLILQAVLNILIPDHKNDGFITPAVNTTRNFQDKIIHATLSGLTRWDAQYFLHISMYGYVYENSLAFFPAYPTIIKVLGYILKPLLPFSSVFYRHTMASVLFNLICFVWATKVLFDLTYREFKDEKFAYLSAIFFCFNPASIFFSAAYSESLFTLLSISAMLMCDKLIVSSILITLSACTRSNGLLNIGFPLYGLIIRYLKSRRDFLTITIFLSKVLLVSVISIIGFISFQIYSYLQFCDTFPVHIELEVLTLASYKGYILRGSGSEGMCSSFLPYFYIQNHYWNVGPLHYFRWKQMPNFILAFPILLYCVSKCCEYLYPKWRILLRDGLQAVSKFKSDAKLFPYVLHLCVLLIVCFFFVHIQVSTRLLCSSSPLVYWFFSKSLDVNVKNEIDFSSKDIIRLFVSSSYIFYYCLSYYFVGTLLFSNGFPWT